MQLKQGPVLSVVVVLLREAFCATLLLQKRTQIVVGPISAILDLPPTASQAVQDSSPATYPWSPISLIYMYAHPLHLVLRRLTSLSFPSPASNLLFSSNQQCDRRCGRAP
ncbi:hypothetical protein B0H16DRAFT_129915 [Mycena metata]|uniref:Secreted protein n=1 Tax=Mycena metata TaxID=1033252 RepID=A0AAD7MVZ7_9AGAR|nr:hypothetical protein B0H16DRAFT_129915 [Mycena metata]